jgi:pimeloyl-ACP methyl ester carboxylesterase
MTMCSALCAAWSSAINVCEIAVLSVCSSRVAAVSFLDVPGARLYYETRGGGPLLFMIGSPMDSTGFATLAEIMAATHAVVTYDPRGIGNSTREDAEEDITPELQADDVHRLIGALGGGPVDYLGSSGGAVVGLALVQAHPDVLRTLVAHEPPVIEELPDSQEQRVAIHAIYDAYMTDGWQQAMQMFMTHIGVAGGGGAPQWEPTPEQLARMEATNKVFFGHLIRQTTAFRPDVEALKAAQTRMVVGVGATSKGQLAHRTGLALAKTLGVDPVVFPGDHGGFMGQPGEFARALHEVLR